MTLLRTTCWVAAIAAVATLASARARADERAPVLVAVSGGGCPQRGQLEEALRARGLVVVDRDAPFRVDVATGPEALRLVVRDADRAPILERTVATADCGALAETVALLVERRLGGVEWQAPIGPLVARPAPPPPRAAARVARAVAPPAPPERPWSLDLFAGGRYSTSFREGAGGVGPALDLRLRAPAPYGVRLAAAWLVHPDLPAGRGTMEIRRLPITLAGGRSFRGPGVELDLEAALTFEVLSVATRDITEPAATTRVALRAGLAAALGVEVLPHLWLLGHGGAHALLSGYDFVLHRVTDPSEKTVVATQTASVEAGLALGGRIGP